LASWGSALTIVAAFGIVGAFIDFYIGKRGQQRVREWLETWWLRLSYVRWGNIGREEALFAVQVMDRLFGERFFSWKRIGLVILVTLACAALILTAILFEHIRLHPWPAYFTVDNMAGVIVILFSLNASFSITRFAAKIVASLLERTNYLGLLGLIFLFLFQCTLFIYWSSLTNLIRFGMSFAYPRPFNLWEFIDNIDKVLDSLKHFISIYNTQGLILDPKNVLMFLYYVNVDAGFPQIFMLHLSAFTNALSSFIRLSIMTIFMLSFFLKPLQNAIMTLWVRVIESDKPVFTLVFGGTAALAKAIQEIAKILW
jgi:predicted outer membrane lipoprotein